MVIRLILVSILRFVQAYDTSELEAQMPRFSETCSCPFDCMDATIYNNSIVFLPQDVDAEGYMVFRERVTLDVNFAGAHACQEINGLAFCRGESTVCGENLEPNYLIYSCEDLVHTIIAVGAERADELEDVSDERIDELLENVDLSLYGDLDERAVLIYALTVAAGFMSCSDDCNYYSVCAQECNAEQGTIDESDRLRAILQATNLCNGTIDLLTPTSAPTTTFPSFPPTSSSPLPTFSPLPTSSPLPTLTSQPTAIPSPTFSPLPTMTNMPTTTPLPTLTNLPTTTPLPTLTNLPTTTPLPTLTNLPTITSLLTPLPTLISVTTPRPTALPTLLPAISSKKNKKNNNLNTGALAGIIVAAIVLFLFCCCLAFFCCFQRSSSNGDDFDDVQPAEEDKSLRIVDEEQHLEEPPSEVSILSGTAPPTETNEQDIIVAADQDSRQYEALDKIKEADL